MASLLRILLEIFRRLRPAKDHIKLFLRRWASALLAYLIRKMGEWRFMWRSNPGTIRNPKPAEPSFRRGWESSPSVSSGSVCTGGIGGYVVAASTVPASANQPMGRGRAELQPDTAPPTPTLATLTVDPPWAQGPSTTNHTVGSSHANHSSGSLSTHSRASDRLSVMSTSRTSLRASVQNDRQTQHPRATKGQFGLGPGASWLRGRSSRSPSPQPSLHTDQPDNLGITPAGVHTYAPADGVINPTIGLQGLADLPSSSSHTQERPGRSPIHRQKQWTTSIGLERPESINRIATNHLDQCTRNHGRADGHGHVHTPTSSHFAIGSSRNSLSEFLYCLLRDISHRLTRRSLSSAD